MITRRALLYGVPWLALGSRSFVTQALQASARGGSAFVYNAVSGDASVVRDLGTERARLVELPGLKLGRWNVRIGVADDRLLTLDTESRRIHAISLDWVREQVRSGAAAKRGAAVQTTELRAKTVPYRAVMRGDRVWVDSFASNRIEAYQWVRASARLEYVGEHVLPGSRPLGLSDLLIRGDQLWVAASGISCLARICPKETKPDPHVFAFRLDREPLGEPVADLRPSNVNAAGLYLHPGTNTAYVLNAGDYRAGYSSLQRIRDGALGPEIRLASNAGAARAVPLDARTFAVLQFSGEHVIVVDALEDRVLDVLRFDGSKFAPVDRARPLPERYRSDLQDVLPDPEANDRFYIVDSKREQLLQIAFRAPSGLELIATTSLRTAAFRSSPSWAIWFDPKM